MRPLDEVFAALQKSAFRKGFRLRGKDLAYLQQKGLPVVLGHAQDFLVKRLQPAVIPNDGKQTPFRGHPYSSRSMRQLAAAGTVWRNGIAYREGEI